MIVYYQMFYIKLSWSKQLKGLDFLALEKKKKNTIYVESENIVDYNFIAIERNFINCYDNNSFHNLHNK